MPTPNKVFLFGQQVGATTLYALDIKGGVIAAVRLVVEYNLDKLTREIAGAVPGAQVELEPTLNDLMIVRGKVKTAIDAQRVIELVQTYLEASSVANINPDKPGGGGGGGRRGSQDGSPSDKTQVINQLQVELSSQVNIQVRVVEVSRSLSHELGFDWRSVLNTVHGPIYFGTGDSSGLFDVARGTGDFGHLMPTSGAGIGRGVRAWQESAQRTHHRPFRGGVRLPAGRTQPDGHVGRKRLLRGRRRGARGSSSPATASVSTTSPTASFCE